MTYPGEERQMVLWAMGIGAAASLAWWASLWLWPLKKCPRCRDGRIHGHGNVRRVCKRCGGTKEVRRFGARKEQ